MNIARILAALLSYSLVGIAQAQPPPPAAASIPTTAIARASESSETKALALAKALQVGAWEAVQGLHTRPEQLDLAGMKGNWSRMSKDAGTPGDAAVVRSQKRTRDEVLVELRYKLKKFLLHVVFEEPGGPLVYYVFQHSIDQQPSDWDYNALTLYRRMAVPRTVYATWESGVASSTFTKMDGWKIREVNTVRTSLGTQTRELIWVFGEKDPVVKVAEPATSTLTSFLVQRVSWSAYSLADTKSGATSQREFFKDGYNLTNAGHLFTFRAGPEANASYDNRLAQLVAQQQYTAKIEAQNKIWEAQGDQSEQFAMEIDRQNRENAATMMQRELSAYADRESQIRDDADAMLARVAAEESLARQRQTTAQQERLLSNTRAQAQAAEERQRQYEEQQVLAASDRARQPQAMENRETTVAAPSNLNRSMPQGGECAEEPGFRKSHGTLWSTREKALQWLMSSQRSETYTNIQCSQPYLPGDKSWKCTADEPTGLLVKVCPTSAPSEVSRQ